MQHRKTVKKNPNFRSFFTHSPVFEPLAKTTQGGFKTPESLKKEPTEAKVAYVIVLVIISVCLLINVNSIIAGSYRIMHPAQLIGIGVIFIPHVIHF